MHVAAIVDGIDLDVDACAEAPQRCHLEELAELLSEIHDPHFRFKTNHRQSFAASDSTIGRLLSNRAAPLMARSITRAQWCAADSRSASTVHRVCRRTRRS